jgi:RNA polymerase sigma-70 factor (ECF subfamily)
MTPERFIDNVRAGQDALRRFLLALCGGDETVADDIAQDALIRAYVASSNFRGLSKFSTWLFRIAYNCYLDYRKKATIETVSVDSKQVLDMPSGDDPDRSFRYQHLYQALEQLQEKEKVVIVLYYFEDLSIKEIASILQMPVGTVKYHLSNGRNHLRNFLQ